MNVDLFICHASEDKDTFVRPLANILRDYGAEVWYDEFSLRVGDPLSRAIDRGLASAKYGVAVISKVVFLWAKWGSGLCFSSTNRDSTRRIEMDQYLLGMETSSVDSVEF